MSNDERLARELQEAEMGQRSGEPDRPVVQGKPVGLPGVPERMGAAPVRLPPHGAAVIISPLPPAEMIVLNYRLAVSCFAFIDVITTVMNVVTLIRGQIWGLFGLILLIGPICGFIGARYMKRNLVAVYAGFCILKVAFEIALAISVSLVASTWAFLWMLLIALIQFWIMKIVLTFWQALHRVTPERLKQLLDDPDPPAEMVYW